TSIGAVEAQVPDDLPKDLEDSARIDGCGRLRLYWHIALPLAKPAIVVLVIFNILAVWNEYILAMLVLSDKSKMPLQRGLMVFQGAHVTEYPLLMAGIVITVIPVLAVYLILQKHIIKGIAAGSCSMSLLLDNKGRAQVALEMGALADELIAVGATPEVDVGMETLARYVLRSDVQIELLDSVTLALIGPTADELIRGAQIDALERPPMAFRSAWGWLLVADAPVVAWKRLIAAGAVLRGRVGLPGLSFSQFHPMQRGQLLRQVRKKMAVSVDNLLVAHLFPGTAAADDIFDQSADPLIAVTSAEKLALVRRHTR
ncbi:MAG: carbohydrate ABC transporter permease, partial [Planctomycetes bacterium]|nr:carbohydrate ABC transporter permease [Planctomycetota bacterium]